VAALDTALVLRSIRGVERDGEVGEGYAGSLTEPAAQRH
jgi:hypothetical protein